MYHIFFIQSFADGHLGCFHVLAIVIALLWTLGCGLRPEAMQGLWIDASALPHPGGLHLGWLLYKQECHQCSSYFCCMTNYLYTWRLCIVTLSQDAVGWPGWADQFSLGVSRTDRAAWVWRAGPSGAGRTSLHLISLGILTAWQSWSNRQPCAGAGL